MNDADIERLMNEARSKGILPAKWVDDALPLLPPTSCQCDWCADRRAGKQMVAAAPADDWPTFDFGAAIREGVLSGSRPDPDSQAAIKRATDRLLPEEWVRKQGEPDAGSLAAAIRSVIIDVPTDLRAERGWMTAGSAPGFVSCEVSPIARALMADPPQTITRAADDMSFIAKRAKEIEEERIQSLRNRDPEVAGAEHLDRIADDYGEKRQGVESDYTFRQRLLKKIRGEA